MSDAPPGKSHTATWTLLLLAVPVLYILTVPMMKYAVVRPKLNPLSGHVSKSTYRWQSTAPWPDWLYTYCAPFDWVLRRTPLGPSLRHYQEWCFKLCEA
jgi:hypothetical protein